MRLIPILTSLLLALPAHAALNIEWVIGDEPGNVADPVEGYGSVGYSYRISVIAADREGMGG